MTQIDISTPNERWIEQIKDIAPKIAQEVKEAAKNRGAYSTDVFIIPGDDIIPETGKSCRHSTKIDPERLQGLSLEVWRFCAHSFGEHRVAAYRSSSQSGCIVVDWTTDFPMLDDNYVIRDLRVWTAIQRAEKVKKEKEKRKEGLADEVKKHLEAGRKVFSVCDNNFWWQVETKWYQRLLGRVIKVTSIEQFHGNLKEAVAMLKELYPQIVFSAICDCSDGYCYIVGEDNS